MVHGAQQDALFAELSTVLKSNGNFHRYCPVRSDDARHKWISSQWRSEAAFNQEDNNITTKLSSLFEYLMKSIMTTYTFVFDEFNSITGLPSRYLTELPEQCDWVKASGSLYLILDMTQDEQKSFQSWLECKERSRALKFGSHASDAAIVT